MKTSYILMIVTIISKIFGLAREKALAQFFGTSIIADVFLVAFQIPMTFTNVISGATANGYIPIYNEILETSSEEEANKFTSNLSNIVLLLTFFLSLLGLIFSKNLVNLMAIGFTGEKLELAVYMTRIALLSIAATTFFSIFKAYLQIKKKFIVSIAHAIIMNIIIIAAMYIAKKTSVNYLAWGIFFAFVFQYIIFIPYITKSSYKHKFIFDLKDENFRKLMKIILPVIISTSVIELNFIISKSLSSELFSGAISSLNYAYKLQGFVTGIVVTSIVTAVYPEMAKAASEKDFSGLKEKIQDSIITMSFLVVPATIGLFILAEPIVKLLFVGGAFSKQDGVITAEVLALYSFGIIGIGFREIISRVFYTIMDAKTPVINSIIIVLLNIGLSLILIGKMGILGLALATSVSFIVGAILIIISANRRIGSVFSKKSIKELLKILIAALVMGVIAKVSFKYLNSLIDFKIAMLLAIGLSGLSYLILLIVFKSSEIYNFTDKIKARKNKN